MPRKRYSCAGTANVRVTDMIANPYSLSKDAIDEGLPARATQERAPILEGD